jgi:phosphopantothenate synthetase
MAALLSVIGIIVRELAEDLQAVVEISVFHAQQVREGLIARSRRIAAQKRLLKAESYKEWEATAREHDLLTDK